ncbi:MAG: hypothetical protein GX638_00735 [Crenarchaeota archaeon]|nr:hypothetical protein [Thermoproteota archaeon]
MLKFISYLTALKNRRDEMAATDIMSLTGQGYGNVVLNVGKIKLMITILEPFTFKIGIITYLTALKNRRVEIAATDIMSLTGQGKGIGNMEIIG